MNELALDLKAVLEGDVDFTDGGRALYATDASNYRQVPIGVVIPKTIDEVIKTVEICRKYGAPILTRGAGTSLAGQCCNVAVIIDFSRHLNKILEIDPVKKIARVQPGVILDQLRAEAKKYGLTFGPDPATHNRCTIGGMIGNNACGVHSVVYGKTVENVEALEILTYEGVRMRVGVNTLNVIASPLPPPALRADRPGGKAGAKQSPGSEIVRHKASADPPAQLWRTSSQKPLLAMTGLRDRYADLIRSRYPKLPRRVSGYNLDELLPEKGFNIARSLVGTEGTCVIFLEAELKLTEEPAYRSLAVLGYPDIYQAADDIPRVLSFGPIGVEGLDEFYVRNMKKSGLYLQEIADLPEGNGWLLVEFGGRTQQEADDRASVIASPGGAWRSPISNSEIASAATRPRNDLAELRPRGRNFSNPIDQKRIWALREASFGASVFVPGEKDTFSGFEDSAVPPAVLGNYLRELRKLYQRYHYDAITYGHFGDGCVHTRFSFDLKTNQGIEIYKQFLEEAADLVVKFGGSFSGEHGDGQTWGHLLPKMYGEELVQAFREFKRIWDPQNKMNPGKVVDSYGVDENLRQRIYPKIPQGDLHFSYGDENGDFARETERCIGIGRCLKTDEGIMCPSYMVTRDEKHSTRGRAHLLHEMMRGEVIKDGWKSEEVKEALDLCLACKGCKSECPVKVDVATYKAEFLSHYYKGKRRPLSAYLFGLIARWAAIGAKWPWLINFLTQTPVLKNIAKMIAGIASQRQLPEFASQTFRGWFNSRGGFKTRPYGIDNTVILWPDTFTNYFHPEIAKAAVEVLEYAGFQVKLPAEGLCCGRPLYDYGMLSLAKEYLEKIMARLKNDLEKGACVVGLEPSCIAVFRDELGQLFPGNHTAQLLGRQSYVFAEFLEKFASQIAWPQLKKEAVIQGHCHQQAVMGLAADKKIYERLGLNYRILDSGCCGMAGGFGFEKDHYEVSVRAAGRVLLPALEKISEETLIMADGFSCREQIHQLGGRRALHLAEVLQMAIRR